MAGCSVHHNGDGTATYKMELDLPGVTITLSTSALAEAVGKATNFGETDEGDQVLQSLIESLCD